MARIALDTKVAAEAARVAAAPPPVAAKEPAPSPAAAAPVAPPALNIVLSRDGLSGMHETVQNADKQEAAVKKSDQQHAEKVAGAIIHAVNELTKAVKEPKTGKIVTGPNGEKKVEVS